MTTGSFAGKPRRRRTSDRAGIRLLKPCLSGRWQLRNSEFEIRNEWIGERRLRLLGAIIVCLAAALGMEALAQDQPVADQKSGVETAARKKQREENLKAMQERARATKIRLTGDAKGRADLITQPLFHYTDEPRRITDATLWGWTFEGRLLAVCKIEKYDIDD